MREYRLKTIDNNNIKKDPKNPYIELCRFVAACVIMFHHTEKIGGFGVFGADRIALGGWIFVEYFFILSGYFMTRHFVNLKEKNDNIEKNACKYTIKKLLKIMPFASAGICLDVVVKIGSGEIDATHIGNLMVELPAHFLFLKGLNILKFDINSPLWYLTGILIAMPLLIGMLLRFKDFYKYIACWIFPLIIYAILFTVNGNIQYWDEGWAISCLLRAFAGLMLGSVTFYISEYMKSKSFTRNMNILLSILEVVLFVTLVMFSFLMDCLDYTIPCIMFSIITLCISFSGQDCIQKYFPKQALFLGKLSLPLYCLHRPVYDLIRWLCEGMAFNIKLLIAISASFILSGLMIWITERFSGLGIIKDFQ